MSKERDTECESPTEPDSGDRRTAAQQRYRKIFQHNNDAVMIVDLGDETFVDVNPKACELLGYSREELLSMHPEDIHPDDIDRVREKFLSQVIEEGVGFTDEVTCLTKSGCEVPTEISGAALGSADDGGKPRKMIAMLRDISDRLQHRQELEEKIERLDRFASIVSHDLRTPLSVIKGYLSLARETGDAEHFDTIEDAADRMDEMLAELLQLTKEGDLVGDRTEVELAPLAREVWNDCEIQGATLEIDSSTMLQADRERLHALLANLFENAVTHGGESVTVGVGTFETGQRAGVYVEDDGAGIPADEQETVFEWGHTTTEEGTGFGLAIVADIAEAHGWEIGVGDSNSGGTRFEIVTESARTS